MQDLPALIRKYNQNDARRILQLEYTRFDEPLSRSVLNFLLKKYGTDLFYVIDLDGDEMIDAYIFAGEDKDDWIHILSIVVIEEFEGQGIGQFMINYLMDQTREDYKGMRLEVDVHNEHAIHLYQRLGFIEIDIANNYYGKGNDAKIMELKF